MNDADQIKFLLSSIAVQLPVLIVCLLAGIIIVIKWKDAGSGSIWALLGFGLSLALCFLVPIGQTVTQRLFMPNVDLNHRAAILGALSMVWSLLRAASYALLLIAVFAGRSAKQPVSTSPLAANQY